VDASTGPRRAVAAAHHDVRVRFTHLLEIIAYAALLRLAVELELGQLRGELVHPQTDYFYFSAVTITTVGFGDLTPSPGLRLLTAVEALNGIVMVGVTTSAMLVVLARALELRVPFQHVRATPGRSSGPVPAAAELPDPRLNQHVQPRDQHQGEHDPGDGPPGHRSTERDP
jgi:hypothetical protein